MTTNNVNGNSNQSKNNLNPNQDQLVTSFFNLGVKQTSNQTISNGSIDLVVNSSRNSSDLNRNSNKVFNDSSTIVTNIGNSSRRGKPSIPTYGPVPPVFNPNPPVTKPTVPVTPNNPSNDPINQTPPLETPFEKPVSLGNYDLNGDNVIDDNETAHHLLLARRTNNTNVLKDLNALNKNANEIQQIIVNVDTRKDGRITDIELSNALIKSKNGSLNFDKQLMDLVFSKNSNQENINKIHNSIDSDSNGRISRTEFMDTLLASKKGLIDIQNPLVRSLLSTNPDFTNLMKILPAYDSSLNGNISNKEAFDILLALRKDRMPRELASKALNLGNNDNAEEIDKSISFFDKNNDGNLTSAEFVNGVLSLRKPMIQPNSGNQQIDLPDSNPGGPREADHALFFNIIKDIPELQNLITAINHIDKNQDGEFSDQEVVEMSFAVAKGSVQFSDATLNSVLASNSKSRDIRNLFDRVDADDNGNISDLEVVNSVLDLKRGRINRNLSNVFTMILSENTNTQDLIDGIQIIDSNDDGVISADESLNAQIQSRKGYLTELDSNILNTVCQACLDKDKVAQVLNFIDPDANGVIDDIQLFTKALSFETGTSGLNKEQTRDLFYKALLEFDEDSNVRNALLGFDQGSNGVVDNRDFANGLMRMSRGDIYLSPELFNHIKSLSPSFTTVQNVFDTLDPNRDSQVTSQEFVDNFNKVISVNGQVNFERLSLVSSFIDVFYPNARNLQNLKTAIDVDNNNVLTNQELITGFLKIKRGEIPNPGTDIISALVGSNPDAQKIISLVNQIDTDNDGRVSNAELANNFLKIRKNEFQAEDLGFVQAILNSNDKYNDVQTLVNLFDRNQDGNVGDLELFDALLKIKTGAYTGFADNAVINLLKSKNPNTTALEAVLRNFDSSNDGKSSTSEMISGFLKVVSGQVTEPSAEIMNSLVDSRGDVYGASKIAEIKNFVTAVDKDRNGQISDLEVIDMIITQRNPSDNITFNTDLYNAVIEANTNSANINSFITSIDPDNNGTFSNTEINNIITKKREGTFTNVNPQWVNHILAKNPTYSGLMTLIDIDTNGSISDAELVTAMRKNKLGEFSSYSSEIVNNIFSTNPRLSHFQTLYNFVDPNGNGVIADSEVINSLLKYKDDNLKESFRSTDNLTAADMTILESLLSTNSNYPTLKTQLDTLTTTFQGDLHEMNNKLQDIRSGAVTDTSYAQLVPAMTGRLDQWVTDRVNIYKQKVTNLRTSIAQDSVEVAVGATSNEKRLYQDLKSSQVTIDAKNRVLQTKKRQLQTSQDLLARTTPNTNLYRTRLNSKQAKENEVNTAQTAFDQAKEAKERFKDSAYTTLAINTSTKTLMERVITESAAVKAAKASNSSSYFSKLDTLLKSYAELTLVLPPNKEKLLSEIFFNDLNSAVNTFPRSS